MHTYHSPTSTGAAAGPVCWAKIGAALEAADRFAAPSLCHSPTWAVMAPSRAGGMLMGTAVVDDFGTLVGVPS